VCIEQISFVSLCGDMISTDFTNPASKTVNTESFSTQCYVYVCKDELCVWILKIFADK
jgi:hypothetical protein